MNMNVSANGIKFIASFEGLKLIPYNDIRGFATRGYGHLIRRGPITLDDLPITEEQALDELNSDAAWAVSTVNKEVTVNINQNQMDALTSFVYNVGSGNFTTSTLLKKLNANDPIDASNEFLKWTHAGTIVSKGLLRRRQAERELFLKI